MTTRTLTAIDTELCADSAEFCPSQAHSRYLAVGTYQVLEDKPKDQPETSSDGLDGDTDGSESTSAPRQTRRTGRLVVFEVPDEEERSSNDKKPFAMKEVFRQDTAAILDIKWSHQLLGNQPVAAVVTATGDTLISCIDNNGAMHQYASANNGKDGVLNLAVDWANRVDANAGHAILVSQSDGSISRYTIASDTGLICDREWAAHGFEAWTVGYNYHQTHTVYSGGDDCLFGGWDMRTECDVPIFTSKRHQAGVCSISSHPTRENMLVTGSYDQHIFVWDTRSMRSPVASVDTGGGVWRLRWHPSDPSLLLAACMYNGFHVFSVDAQGFTEIKHVDEYMHHKSIAYGADWFQGTTLTSQPANTRTDLVATCSFYDHLLHLWSFESDAVPG